MSAYRRRRVGGRRRVGRPRRRVGRGPLMNAIRSGLNFLKRNKIISTVGSALGKVGVPYAGAIGTAAGALGYGRKRRSRRRVGRPRVGRGRVRRVRKRRVGRGLRDILAKAHGFIKRNQLVSKGLNHFGHSKLASAASALGYGRRVGGGSIHQVAAIKF